MTRSLQAAFETDLSQGERYQQAYQQYESEKIAAGSSIEDDHFYDDFQAAHSSIASPIGTEETFVRVPRSPINEYEQRRRSAYGFLCAGGCAFATALLFRWRSASRLATLVVIELRACGKPLDLVHSALVESPRRESGGTGRRAGFRFLCRKACGFDSRLSHFPQIA